MVHLYHTVKHGTVGVAAWYGKGGGYGFFFFLTSGVGPLARVTLYLANRKTLGTCNVFGRNLAHRSVEDLYGQTRTARKRKAAKEQVGGSRE